MKQENIQKVCHLHNDISSNSTVSTPILFNKNYKLWNEINTEIYQYWLVS